ncbi:MAG TPA: MAPEG family protein [Candidatus Binatia bacterium]|jgi:hypothetical protein
MGFAFTCIGLLGLLVFGLGLGVSLRRGSTNRAIGHELDPTDTLHKWVRAHANACEYAPMLAVLIYALASTGPSKWHNFLFLAAVVVRYCHAAGMIASPTLAEGHPLRFVGALGTYVVGLLLCMSALF